MKKGFYMSFRLKEFIIGLLAVLICTTCVCLLDYNKIINTTSEMELTQEVGGRIKIIIDPGHGEFDGGTQSASGILEKDINLDISLLLRDKLNSMGYEIIMTRDTDIVLSDADADSTREKKSSDLKNRLKLINENPDAVFVSIHQNYFTQTQYSGTQVFYSKNNPGSLRLAQTIQTEIAQDLQKDNQRQIKASGSEIFLLYKAQIPAVMVECGFLSNVNEAEMLTDEKYQKKLASEIAEAIDKYICNKG